ncbi:unnamed protein product [Meganyctiphanes norvegica]|uniref:SAM domain-containing protein n=1 Tax=Meganyctiphanes norvegica TaxID=48144 RepID=A0AAV2QCZ6_MEGNR
MVTMTDLETPAAVSWPKWCYANTASKDNGKLPDSDVSKDLALNNNTITSKGYDIKIQTEPARVTSGSPRDVKSERLSPDPSGQEVPTTTTPNGTPSPSTSPKSPTSARTNTPTITGTPPHASLTPPGYDHVNSAAKSLGGMPSGMSVGPPPHLKQMDSLLNRNCSDLMRSLAAKYNNNAPNDYFCAPTSNGFLRPHHAMGLHSIKPNGVPPLISIAPQRPLTSQASSAKDKSSITPVTSSSVGMPPGLSLPGSHMFSGVPGHLPGFPPFPLGDVSSTQVLMNLVRNASATATQQAQLDSYIRGSIKRPAETPTSPLDLSASILPKRPCPDSSKSFDVNNLFNFPNNQVKIEVVKSPSAKSSTPPKSRQTPSPSNNHQTMGLCSEQNCPSLESIAHWTVDDVASFVSNIELCAEYAEAFREQRIDGSTLALLTEEHLTSSIHMKLGPALKLRSVLTRSIDACSVCFHCNHCHNQTQEKRPQAVPGQ